MERDQKIPALDGGTQRFVQVLSRPGEIALTDRCNRQPSAGPTGIDAVCGPAQNLDAVLQKARSVL